MPISVQVEMLSFGQAGMDVGMLDLTPEIKRNVGMLDLTPEIFS